MGDAIDADAVYLFERQMLFGCYAIGIHHADVGGCAVNTLVVILLDERCHKLAGLEVRGEIFLRDVVGVGGDVIFAIIVHHIVDEIALGKVHDSCHHGVVLAVVYALDAVYAVVFEQIPAIDSSPDAVGGDVLAEQFALIGAMAVMGGRMKQSSLSVLPVGKASVYDVGTALLGSFYQLFHCIEWQKIVAVHMHDVSASRGSESCMACASQTLVVLVLNQYHL